MCSGFVFCFLPEPYVFAVVLGEALGLGRFAGFTKKQLIQVVKMQDVIHANLETRTHVKTWDSGNTAIQNPVLLRSLWLRCFQTPVFLWSVWA